MPGSFWQRCAVLFAVIVAGCGDGHDGAPAPASPTMVEFTVPVHLRVDDVADNGHSRIAAGSAGTWVATWGAMTGVFTVRSTDGGVTWGAPVAVYQGSGAATPDIACDRAGGCVIVWVGGIYLDQTDVLAARSLDDGATWSAPVTLSRRDVFDEDPHVATDGRGTWITAWSINGFRGVFTASSHDGGFTWEPAVALPPSGGIDYFPRLAADATGHWVAVWTTYGDTFEAGTRILSAMSADAGGTWSAPTAVTPPPSRENPSIVVHDFTTDGVGTWIAVGVLEHPDDPVSGGRFQEIVTVRSTDGGASWSPLTQLDVPGASKVDLFPRLAADGGGHVVVVWQTYRQANALVALTVQSNDRGVSWTTPSAFPGGEADITIDGLPDFDLATDDRGNWTAAWLLATPGLPDFREPHDIVVARGVNGPARE